MLFWIVLGCALLLLLLSGVSYIVEKRRRLLIKTIPTQSPKQVVLEEVGKSSELFMTEKALEGSAPKYAIIDCQTTGLSIDEGCEDKIVEISWLILDENYFEIERCSKRILQLTAGSPEAKRIHHITEIALANTGEDEAEVLRVFWQSTAQVPIWVFHNAHFDLSILRGAFRHHLPEALEPMMQKVAICTMTYLTAASTRETKYSSLMELTSLLYDIPLHQVSMPPIVSLRNVFLTRACLMRLMTEYKHLLKDNYPISVEQHLLTRN